MSIYAIIGTVLGAALLFFGGRIFFAPKPKEKYPSVLNPDRAVPRTNRADKISVLKRFNFFMASRLKMTHQLMIICSYVHAAIYPEVQFGFMTLITYIYDYNKLCIYLLSVIQMIVLNNTIDHKP